MTWKSERMYKKRLSNGRGEMAKCPLEVLLAEKFKFMLILANKSYSSEEMEYKGMRRRKP